LDNDVKDSIKKKIYIVSDGTGQSAINVIKASLIQFEDVHSILRVFSKADNINEIKKIIKLAREEQPFIAFTIVKKELREYIHKCCHNEGLLHHDILGPPIDKLSSYLGVAPKENPNLLRKVDDRYFKRIDAIEFTINNDDGKNVKKIHEADVVILGLSRTSKTPTSYFLAQQGYKVVNIPIVPEVPLPKEIFEIDQNKVVCLVMDPEVLQKIRSARLKHYKTSSNYTNLSKIFDEVEMVYDLIKKNRQWHIIDTTNKSIEETSREIISAVFGQELIF
jgi:regulator of PEP synthase PpsR (kinase-PPPase family)